MTHGSSYLLPKDIDVSWKPFIDDSTFSLLKQIESKVLSLPDSVTPEPERMLRFLKLNLNSVKVVILGQDPYPQQGVATGRAFEVGPLKKWTDPFRNTSLRNIVRALYAASHPEIKTFNEIKKELEGPNSFDLLPPGELFKYWEKQGVLLLNTSFSCQLGKPGSHALHWRPFTNRLLRFVNAARPEAVWFLWGNHAKEAVNDFQPDNCLITTHPMICHQRPNDFLFGEKNVFFETKELVDWIGAAK